MKGRPVSVYDSSLQIENKEIHVIIDTGAGITLIGGKLYDEIKKGTIQLDLDGKSLTAVNGGKLTIRGKDMVLFSVGENHLLHEIKVVEELGWICLLGTDLLKRWNAVIDFDKEEIVIGKCRLPLT